MNAEITLSEQLLGLANITTNAVLHRRPMSLAELEQLSLTLLNLSGAVADLENQTAPRPRAEMTWENLSADMLAWRSDIEAETNRIANINAKLGKMGSAFRLNLMQPNEVSQ